MGMRMMAHSTIWMWGFQLFRPTAHLGVLVRFVPRIQKLWLAVYAYLLAQHGWGWGLC